MRDDPSQEAGEDTERVRPAPPPKPEYPKGRVIREGEDGSDEPSPDLTKGRLLGAVLSTALLTVLTSNGTSLCSVSQSQEEIQRQAKQAEEEAARIDRRVEEMYEKQLRPIIEGMVHDIKVLQEEAHEVHALTARVRTHEALIGTLEHFVALRNARVWDEIDKVKAEEAKKPVEVSHKHESHTQRALEQMQKEPSSEQTTLVEGKLPSYRALR